MRIERIKQGEPVELSPEKKVAEALQLHISSEVTPSIRWVSDVKIDHLETNQRGDKLSKKFAHNEYLAAGALTMSSKNATTGVLARPTKKKFEIKFKDILDHNGLPDLAVERVTVT